MSDEFGAPQFECDLILKGGITSGIVYPPAISELARTHRFRDIAGASAGAIGAAAAAAAELGRASTTGGFELLSSLPDELQTTDEAGRTTLFRLFEPQNSTRPLFDLIWDVRSAKGRARVSTALTGVIGLAGALGWLTLLGAAVAALAVIVIAAAVGGAGTLWLSIPLAILLVVVAGAVALALGVRRVAGTAPATLRDNFHGLVNGSTQGTGSSIAVTDWLSDAIQRLAGRDDPEQEAVRSVPVTHGELATAGISMVAITTNLSRGTSEQVPFDSAIWAFDPDQLGRLFPPDVVAHMVRHRRTDVDDDIAEALGDRLCLLPPPEQLPVIVAARMSLSFPVLLSAVPLHGLTIVREGGAWRKRFVENWFSDGGITSNLPVHLFDTPLPRRPTYAINLAGGGDPSDPPEDNVWRPIDARSGRRAPTKSIESTADLLSAVFDTMQNWADNDLSRTPGFTERICTVRLGDGEGGMNLDMGPETIAPLVQRGAAAGRNLASMRTGDLDGTGIEPDDETTRQWDRHRWTRYRIAGAQVGRLVERVGQAIDDPTPPTLDDLGDEAAGDRSPLPYSSDWSATRQRDVTAMWTAVRGLGGQPPSRFGDGPAGVGLHFGAEMEPAAVEPTPVRPPPTAAG